MKNQVNRQGSDKRNFSHNVLMLCPDFALYDFQSTCIVILDAPLPSNSDFYVKFLNPCKSTFVRGDRVNDTTLAFKSPGNFPVGEAKLSIHYGHGQTKLCSYSRNFTFKSKVERVYDLLQTTSDPLNFLATAFGIDGKDFVAIDFKLEHALRGNMPQNFNLLQNHLKGTLSQVPLNGLSNPTLLHFAARYNLVRLFVALLECPGAQEALQIKNRDGQTPASLADSLGYDHLSEIVDDSHSTTRPLDRKKSVDEIYEHMSAELYDHYIEVKKDFYEDMTDMGYAQNEDDVYEDMYERRRESANSRTSIPMDRQSVYSSDSALSSTSNDSRGSASYPYQTSDAPAVPPSDYKRPNKLGLSPLVSELKRKTDEKFMSSPDVREIYNNPPSQAPQRPPHQTRPVPRPNPRSPVGKKTFEQSVNEIYDTPPAQNQKPLHHTLHDPPHRGDQEVYDVPPSKHNILKEEFYDTPPPRRVVEEDNELYDTPPNRHNNHSEEAELYDTPPTRSTNNHSEEDDVYDTPPVRSTQPHSTDEVYDIPPPQQRRPPPRGRSQDAETYDTPPPTTQNRLSRGRIVSDQEIYNVPPTRLNDNNNNNNNNNNYNDEIYDDVTPLRHSASMEDLFTDYYKHGGRNVPNLASFGKRMSEPAINIATRTNDPSKPALPPPNLPRRNPNFGANKIHGRPMPPLPPQRR